MNVKKIVALVIIYLLACAGWAVLGTTTHLRSTDMSGRLHHSVEKLWGARIVQQAPSFQVLTQGSSVKKSLIPVKNDIVVDLELEHRKKGLIWHPTYSTSFSGVYTLRNDEDLEMKVKCHFNFPLKGGTYDSFACSIDGVAHEKTVNAEEGIRDLMVLKPGDEKVFSIAYKTRGLETWTYQNDLVTGRIKNFSLVVNANFNEVDYQEGSLSPMVVKQEGDKSIMRWEASDLITRSPISIEIPEKLNPGPVSTRITFFAPVCLLFFFVLIGTIHIVKKIDIHPMHYLFVASGFFAFHLLLAYLVDILDIHLSFFISAVVSISLVTYYLSTAVRGFPWKVATAGQFFFMVLFSYSFFFKGVTGLTVALGSVATLAVLMRVTASVDWNHVFTSSKSKKSLVLEEG